ncbi:MAG: MraY family glycosyltransferase [Acidobacteriota bacterium]
MIGSWFALPLAALVAADPAAAAAPEAAGPATALVPYAGLAMTFLFVLWTTSGLCGPMARLATRVGLVDRPAPRKAHAAPTPLLGGLAIHGPLLAALGGWALWGLGALAPVLAAAALLLVAGLWDDRRGLGVAVKLGVQLAASGALVMAGVRLGLPFLPSMLEPVATLLWLVAITNAVNLLDNLDGLAASVVGASALGILTCGLRLEMPVAVVVGALLAAACAGFLRHNAPPAKLFMGDAGSLPLGLLTGFGVCALTPDAGAIGSAPSSSAWPLAMALLLAAVPLLDTSTVVIARLRRGVNPLTTPGTDHLSHRLARRAIRRRDAEVAGASDPLGSAGAVAALGLLQMTASLLAVVVVYAVAG